MPDLPALSARGALVTGFAAILTLVLVFGLWGTRARIAGAVIAEGRVEVDLNRRPVQHPEGGVVARVAVREGEHVAAGQVLMVLDGAALRSEARQTADQLLDLQARKARLVAERDGAATVAFPAALAAEAARRPEVAALLAGQRQLFAARGETFARQQAQLDAQVAQIARQIDGIDAQIAAARTRLSLTATDLATQRSLRARGLAPAARVLALEAQQADLQGSIGALRASRAQAESRATETRIAALKLDAARREDATTQLRRIAPRILALAEQLRAQRTRIARLTIRAPVAGIAYDLAVTAPQSVLRPADPALYIVPQDRPLIVAARIPPAAIDDVTPGAEVRLRVTAIHDRLAPDVTGRVATIAPDRLTDPRTGADYYRVRIALSAPAHTDGAGHAILPGMPVEAFIATASRSPLAYLLGPVQAYFDHAFRDGGSGLSHPPARG